MNWAFKRWEEFLVTSGLKRAPWTFLSLYQLKKVTCICNNMTVSNSNVRICMATLPFKVDISIDQCVLKKHFYSVSNLQLVRGPSEPFTSASSFLSLYLFSWLKSSLSTHLIRMKDPHRSTENKHHSMWCPLENFSYLIRKQNADSPVSVVFSQNTRESAIATGWWVYVRLCVCTSWYHIALKCLLLFLPLLEGVWLTGGEGSSQQPRVLAHPVRGREWQASSASGASRNKDDNGERDWTTQMAEPSTQRCHPYHINIIHTPTREDHGGKNN